MDNNTWRQFINGGRNGGCGFFYHSFTGELEHESLGTMDEAKWSRLARSPTATCT